MLKRENVKEIRVENEKVFVYFVDGTRKEIRAVKNKEFLKHRTSKENFDTLTYVIEDYNEYIRECNRVTKLAKSRYLVDCGVEFKKMTGRQGIFQYNDCIQAKKKRVDGTIVTGYEYILCDNVTLKDLEKLHNSFDNVVAMQYRNGKYGLFVGTKKMRNF